MNANDTSSFIVIKDSNAGDDGQVGSERITVRRNVFLNWEGSAGSNFVLVGEDGQPFHEARQVLVENNLMIGNSANEMRTAFGVKGARDITFRNNTVAGNLPGCAYAMRLNQEGANPQNQGVSFWNNVWSDHTGTMGAGCGGGNDFSDGAATESLGVQLDRNLYWNGGAAIPPGDVLSPLVDDARRVVADAGLSTSHAGIVLPRWTGSAFPSGSVTIRQEFERLAAAYGAPSAAGPAVDQADRLAGARRRHPRAAADRGDGAGPGRLRDRGPRLCGHPDFGGCRRRDAAHAQRHRVRRGRVRHRGRCRGRRRVRGQRVVRAGHRSRARAGPAVRRRADEPGGPTFTVARGFLADFLDVPGRARLPPVRGDLVRRGITGGCGGGRFCPDAAVTREQMAVFLLTSKEPAGYVPPPCVTPRFADVPCSSPFARWINELAARGITGGCDANNYCPTAAVTREQMSVFLLSTFEGPGYTPPVCTTPTFSDVPCSSPFARWVNELAARGITGGCSPGLFCPTSPVTRGQMSVFLATTFGL